ncbi:MAG: ATP-binding cassette domain-containing protein [Aeromicrobium erythreum]
MHGDDLHGRRTRRRAAARIAWVPQELRPPARFTVREALAYLAWLRAVPRSRRSDAVQDAAASVDLAELLDRKVGALSGGQVRRLAVAQALLADPDVLLLDEPTTGLDPHQRSQLRALVGRVAQERSVLLASHIVEDVAYLAERVVVLDRGTVRYDGVPGALAHRGRQAGDGPGSDLERGFLDLIGTRVDA